MPQSPIPLGPAGRHVSRRLAELREERHLTLAALSGKLTALGRPISISGLSKIEQALRRTDADDLVALAKALEVGPEDLLGGRPDPRAGAALAAGTALGPPGEVRLDGPLVDLPRPATKVFVGRMAQLAELARAGTGPGVVTQLIRGLGGVGKTETALRYGHTHRDRFPIIWWITADGPGRVEAGLARLAAEVAARVGRQAPPLAVDAATWAVGFLAAHPGWLLVLDSVDDPAAVAPLLGRLSGGQVLITSRRSTDWDEVVDVSIPLDVLDPAAATTLLTTRSGQDDPETAAELAEELGRLPLALAQAASYLARTRLPMPDYLARLRADAAGGIQSVARQWTLTLSTIGTADPLAIDVLEVLSCLAPDNVPRALLTGMADDPGELDLALGLLASYSMISLGVRTVSVHRLVQAVVAERAVAAGTLIDSLRRARDLIRVHRPDGDPGTVAATWPWWGSVITHVEALVARWPIDDADTGLAELLTAAGAYRHKQGAYPAAAELHRRALVIDEAALGSDHPKTLTDRDRLALGLRSLGRYAEAVGLWERTLADRVRVLGSDHPDTLTSRANLAAGYRSAGRYQDAVRLWERTLTDRVRVLGPDHPDTLTSRSNLSFGYQLVGRHAEAVTMDEQTLTARVRVLGPDHPRTLSTRNTLANGYRAVGRYDEAVRLHEQTLTDRLRVLEAGHPHISATRGDLAADYRAVGRYDEAVALDEQVLADRAESLGPDHPRTLTSRGTVALDHEAAGRYDRAAALWERTAADLDRVLGPGHPDALDARDALDRCRAAAAQM